MAINVNKVYRVVLTIMNKEQRGLLTPDQFNRLGRLSQLDLIEKAFYDYNRALNREKGFGVNDEYGDIANNIKEKIDTLSISEDIAVNQSTGLVASTSTSIFKLINVTNASRNLEIQEVTKSELNYLNASPLTAPSSSYPVFYRKENSIYVLPANAGVTPLTLDFIKVHADPNWAFTGGGTSAYAYDSGSSTDFQLHPSEEVSLITRILNYAGVTIKDPDIVQTAANKEVNDFNQQNS